MAPFSIAKVWIKFELPTNGLGANLILTRPSFTNFPISVHESALDTSNMTSPFCSVQTFTAKSPFPMGMESFSFVPNVFQTTSLLATKLRPSTSLAAEIELDSAATQRREQNHF